MTFDFTFLELEELWHASHAVVIETICFWYLCNSRFGCDRDVHYPSFVPFNETQNESPQDLQKQFPI